MRKKLSVFIPMSIMVLMLAACGSSNNSTPSSSDVPNVKEETSTTGQIENSDNADSSVDSSVDSTSTPEPTPTEEPSSTPTQEPTETPTPTPTEEPTPTPEPTPTETPTPTPEPTPTETPTPTPSEEDEKKEPSGSDWSGDYNTLPSDGFDHIKVPTIDDFYDEGLDNPGGAFDFGNRPEWEEEWYDAYNEFLVANGSPIIDDTPIGAFYAINPGSTFINGATYQYLYYGYRGDATNGWGDIVLYNSGLNPSMSDNSNYKDSYILETTNFTYGNMDKGLENEYRAATTMMLSWIVPNPSQVEEVIYGFIADMTGDAILTKHVIQNGFGSWMQVGNVDIAVALSDIEGETFVFAIRNHK